MHFAQTLRYFQKTMLADSVDFDITYMAVLIFWKTSILNKMLILGQAPRRIGSWKTIYISAHRELLAVQEIDV